MSKGLEALKEINIVFSLDTCKMVKEHYEIIEKELKAFEILIKMYKPKKYVLDAWLFAEIITREEYDLLKEVLL